MGYTSKTPSEIKTAKKKALSDMKDMTREAEAEKVEKDDQPEETGHNEKDYPGLCEQVKAEYELAHKHSLPKKKRDEARLKLYNNQKRDPKAVGDTTLFTVMQTVLASLYTDRLTAGFGGREEGDDEQAENLDAMAEFDYDEMEKDIVDFDWDFDACFFGRSYLVMEEFVRDADQHKFYPLPEVIDPFLMERDPDATSVNGRKDTGKGAARFLGYPCKMSAEQLEENDHIFANLDYKELKFDSIDEMSQLQSAREARDDAQGRQSVTKEDNNAKLGANSRYDVLIWYTWYKKPGSDEKAKRVKCWVANGNTKLIGVEELTGNFWKILDRPLYPTAHDWDGVSIPDLVEDKQRARAVVSNLVLRAMKSDVYPTYVFDTNKVPNRKDLKIGFNKFIPVDPKGENINTAIAPMQKARFNMGLIDFIYTTLDLSAQKATATPDIQQGIQSSKSRPLGETNIVKVGADTRYSLSAKIFGWSEKRFWQLWYWMYKEYFADDIDEKILRIRGAFGAKYRPLEKKDFITASGVDPDIVIESREVNRALQLEERQSLSAYFALALREPTANRRYALKKLARVYGMKKDEIDRLFPMTIDERVAEQENEKLSKNEFVGVLREDDHNVHLETHSKAKKTDATTAHIKTHERALMLKKTNPELFPQDPTATDFQQGGMNGAPNVPTQEANNPIQPSATSGAVA